jgi:hypothetical protein
MKGKIIQERVYDSIMDWTHGMGYDIKRILIPEANNLAITPHNRGVFAFEFEPDRKYIVLKEIEVPDELVQKALTFMQAKKEFDSLKKQFEMLLEK